ncbi:Protein DESIGUAL 2, partial [Linum perenne]
FSYGKASSSSSSSSAPLFLFSYKNITHHSYKDYRHSQLGVLHPFQSITRRSSMASKNVGVAICLLIMAMDVTAGILGIEADIAQNKVKHLKVWIFECRDPSLKAFKLGIAAAVLLTFAHVIANLLGGCICMSSKEEFQRSSPNRQLAVASLVFSWIALVVGFSMLIIGIMANSKSRKSCGLSHNRVLSVGGILCFIHGLFTIAYFVSANAAAKELPPPVAGRV